VLKRINKWSGGGMTKLFVIPPEMACVVLIAAGGYARTEGGAEKVATSILQNITAGKSQDVIVLFDDSSVQYEAAKLRGEIGAVHDTPAVLELKRVGYSKLKQVVIGAAITGEEEILGDYSHLQMIFMRIDTRDALDRLVARPEILKVFENGENYPVVTPPPDIVFINQPNVTAFGITGGGTTVAVLDTGVNYTLSAFGTCTCA